MKTADGKSAEPHFDEAFLLGKNSKNAVLGEVYHNVSFPFKQEEQSNGINYWSFDSSKTTLAMRKDKSTGEYYLQDTGNQDWSKNVDSSGTNGGEYGFFPFNEETVAASGKNYNYGFGTKLEIKFRLTKDGKVKGNNGEEPITFEFAGDDDVWVFIDGKLALDVGGAHARVGGKLDFSKNLATVDHVKKSAAGIEGNGDSPKETTFTLKGAKEDEHTLTMFYMERGMWESNMKITFNFPDENEFAVEKQVDKSEVNPLFADSFEDASVFPFTIQNQATHYGEKGAGSGTTVKTETFNSFDSNSPALKGSSDNTFEWRDTYQDQNGVAHWDAELEDTTGDYKDRRFGIIPYLGGGTLDASETKKYLDFKLYYDYDDTPTAKCIYLELEDARGNKTGDWLSGKLYGNTTLKENAWNTLTVNLSDLTGNSGFDYSQIKYIKFNYSYPRDIYLDDFVFRSGVQVTQHIGFEVQQDTIPDYGSATSGKLEKPEGAVYSLSDSFSTDTGVIGEDGTFVLADGQTATFRNQFRRGSYISVKEEISSPAFDTTWSLYENGHAVDKVTKNESTVITSGQSVSNVSGKQIKDGRQEKYTDKNRNDGYSSTQWANTNNGKTDDTIVFRSYDNPDDETGVTKLKAVFKNKVKVGSLTIKKEQAKGSDKLTGTYHFQIKFTNVAGMSLEKGDSITIEDISLKQGKSYMITGIPIGTDYEITEKPTDDSSLKKVLINGTEASFNVEKGSVNGTITAETNLDVEFQNNNKLTGNIAVTKKWVKTDGSTPIEDPKQLPDSIYLQLQRKEKDKENAVWDPVDYSGNTDSERKLVEVNRYNGWSYTFQNLEPYVDSEAESKVPWIYRVMEVDAKGNGNVIDFGGTYTVDGKTYRVAYSVDTSTGTATGSATDPAIGTATGSTTDPTTGTATGSTTEPTTATDPTVTDIELADPAFATTDGKQPTANMTVTNTYLEKLNLKITKKGKNTTDELLSGVEFKLEKMDSTETCFEPVGSAKTTDKGIATFEELGQGTYRLTETKAAAGYNLLSGSILIEIRASNDVWWKMEKETSWKDISLEEEKVIPLIIYNTKQLILPATGGSGFGLVTMGGIALMAQAILMGTYFTLQCRKGDDKLRKKR